MNKRTLAVIGIVVITASMFAGCKQKDDAVDATASTVSTSQIAVSEESAVSDENTTIEDSSSNNSSAADRTAEKENGSTTTKAATDKTTTAAKTTAKQTTKAAAQTTKSTTKAATQATTRATIQNPTTTKKQCQYYRGSNGGHYRNISEIESHFNEWYIEQLDSGRDGWANYVRYGCDCGGYDAEFYFYDA